MIYYVNDDLFSAPLDMLLVHACNCQGVWGSGIALQFKNKFPEEYRIYKNFCVESDAYPSVSLVANRIGCLFTSRAYGKHVDSPEDILRNTKWAIIDLLSKTTMKIAMPKINSGLFNVPWEQTEAVLKQFPHAEFYIYTGAK
jgi:ADP-ribose 1''-phosphate phosphatase